jgi:sulfate adenylyltransferase
MKTSSIEITRDQYLELEKLSLGVFSPLKGFMGETDFNSCVQNMRLSSGDVFTIPIVFDVAENYANEFRAQKSVDLFFEGQLVGRLFPEDIYKPNKAAAIGKIFGTEDESHPGIKHFLALKEYFIGGKVELIKRPQFEFSHYEMTPEETKSYFKSQGWKTIVGFQTRNVPHRAHEYLQKVALEHVDGILIQPLVGKKKAGDYTPQAVIKGYEALIKNYYPAHRAKLAILSTVMRYAGPREAVFHAIIRRNYGCTHFIIGRDHAGVGNFYDKYAGHELVSQFEDELGIKIFKLCGPFYCKKCDGTVTEKTCPHFHTDPESCTEISGTMMRKMIKDQNNVDKKFMREEVVSSLQGIDVFIN